MKPVVDETISALQWLVRFVLESAIPTSFLVFGPASLVNFPPGQIVYVVILHYVSKLSG